MMGRVLITVIVLAGVCSPSSAIAQSTIGAPGGGLIGWWGTNYTRSFGQTITVGSVNILTDFSFWFGQSQTNYNIDYRAYVYAWDENTLRLTGSPLYDSGSRNITGSAYGNHVEQTFDLEPLALSSGSMYALFVEALSGGSDVANFETRRAQDTADDYAGGELIFGTGRWWEARSNLDLRFEANFGTPSVVVPEPSTWILLATGVVGIGIVARRRKTLIEEEDAA